MKRPEYMDDILESRFAIIRSALDNWDLKDDEKPEMLAFLLMQSLNEFPVTIQLVSFLLTLEDVSFDKTLRQIEALINNKEYFEELKEKTLTRL